MVWDVTDIDADDSILAPEHVSQMKILYQCYCQPCLLFSSSHKKLECKSVQTWCKSVDLFFSTSHLQHGTQLLRPRMMWEAEAESKTGAQSWQRLSQSENGFLRDRLLQASQDIWSPLICCRVLCVKKSDLCRSSFIGPFFTCVWFKKAIPT